MCKIYSFAFRSTISKVLISGQDGESFKPMTADLIVDFPLVVLIIKHQI